MECLERCKPKCYAIRILPIEFHIAFERLHVSTSIIRRNGWARTQTRRQDHSRARLYRQPRHLFVQGPTAAADCHAYEMSKRCAQVFPHWIVTEQVRRDVDGFWEWQDTQRWVEGYKVDYYQ